MWKLWNKLFGCDYILIKFNVNYVKRVKTSPNGTKYIMWCGAPALFEGENRWYKWLT